MNCSHLALAASLGVLPILGTSASAQTGGCSLTGDGTFGVATCLPAGDYPRGLTAEDLNGDGVLDIAVASADSHDVTILMGVGDGTFGAETSFGVGGRAYSVAAGDLDGDSVRDLVVAKPDEDQVAVLLGLAGGGFGIPTGVSVGDYPLDAQLVDLNGDLVLDLVVLCFGTGINIGSVQVLLGHGDGTFGAPASFPAGVSPYGMVIGDLSGDELLDVAVANVNSDGATVLEGNGDGTFDAGAGFSVGPTNFNPYGIAIGELDGVNGADIVACSNGASGLSVALNAGDGSFLTPVVIPVGFSQLNRILLEDLNGDGLLDAAVTSSSSQGVTVLFGMGDGNFGAGLSLSPGFAMSALLSQDVNEDGVADLIVARPYDDSVCVLLGTPAGDLFEPNDDCGSATVIAQGTYGNLHVWGDSFWSGRSEDFWRYSALPNEAVTIDLLFEHATGDVDLEVYDDPACTSLVGAANSLSNNERVVFENATGSTVELTIRVVPVGSEFTCNSYDLSVAAVVDPCLTIPDDGFAPNQECSSGALIGPGSYDGLMVFADQLGDFYVVDVIDGYTLEARVEHDAASGNLDCYLYDSELLWTTCGDQSSDLTRAASNVDEEILTWDNRSGATKTYVLQVTHRGTPILSNCAGYDLAVSIYPTPMATSICAGNGSLIPCPCGNESSDATTGCKNATGVGAKMTFAGTNSVVADDLVLHLSQARVGQPSMLIQGWTQTALAFKDGILCMGNPTARLEVVQLDYLGAGSSSGSIVSEGTIPGPGVTRFYQFWYRDPAISPCGSGSNFSNGLRVSWE